MAYPYFYICTNYFLYENDTYFITQSSCTDIFHIFAIIIISYLFSIFNYNICEYANVAIIWNLRLLKINRKSTNTGGHKFAFKLLKGPHYLGYKDFCFSIQNRSCLRLHPNCNLSSRQQAFFSLFLQMGKWPKEEETKQLKKA